MVKIRRPCSYSNTSPATKNYSNFKDLLDKEKRVAERRWTKQSKNIEAAISGTAGMYGDFQGIVGSDMKYIPQLKKKDEIQVE